MSNRRVNAPLESWTLTLAPEAAGLAVEANLLLTKNLRKLKDYKANDKPGECLRDWAIVLCVLARDVLDSSAILLKAGQLRGAHMISRALVDYDIRLRYYVVQYLYFKRQESYNPGLDVITRMQAAIDWDNWSYALAENLNHYDRSAWPKSMAESLDKKIQSDETLQGLSFADMLEFLAKNEIRVRGLIWQFKEDAIIRYRSMKANWGSQSTFLHGGQAIVSDVIEFDSDGKKTGKIMETGPVTPNVILFTALDHVAHLLISCEEIHGDSSGQSAFFYSAGRVWQKEYRPESLDEPA